MSLTRIAVGGPGASYGTVTDKSESFVFTPAELLTRIAVGGVGGTYGTITAKSESAVIARVKRGRGMLSMLNVRRSMRSRR